MNQEKPMNRFRTKVVLKFFMPVFAVEHPQEIAFRKLMVENPKVRFQQK